MKNDLSNSVMDALRKGMSGILPSFLQMIPGLGARVLLDQGTAHRGGVVTGSVLVTGNDAQRRLQTYQIQLVRKTPRNGTKAVITVPLMVTDMEPTTGGMRARFSLPVPDDAEISRDHSAISYAVRLVSGGLFHGFSLAETAVKIAPHAELVAMEQALELMGFRRRSGVMVFGFASYMRPNSIAVGNRPGLRALFSMDGLLAPADLTVVSQFSPPPHLREHLDTLTLAAQISDETALGTITLNWTQHGLRERLGALLGKDKEMINLAMPRAELVSRGGQPDRGSAEQTIRPLLEEKISWHTDPNRALLRPTEAPVDSSTLLRPAGAGQVELGNLVVPVSPDSEQIVPAVSVPREEPAELQVRQR